MFNPKVVEERLDSLGERGHGDLTPGEWVTATEPRQARIDHPPAERLGQVLTLPVVHRTTGEVTVDVDRPELTGAFVVVRDGVVEPEPVDLDRVGDHRDIARAAHVALVLANRGSHRALRPMADAIE